MILGGDEAERDTSARPRRKPTASVLQEDTQLVAACGDDVPEIGGRSRAVILRSLTGRLGRGGMAMICQGLPQLVRLNEDVLSTDPDAPDFGDTPVISRVRMLNETPLVPDLERLEHRIADLLEAEAAEG
jgi:hypothetical protein